MAREREMVFEDHMSDNEALMWNIEKDPSMSSWFASLTMLDTAPDMDRLRARLLYTTTAVPRLRQRVSSSLGRWAPPRWVDDHRFDIDFHVRRIAAPSPGGLDEVADLAVKILLDPFDRSRPLWQFTVIEGLAGGKAAMVQKIHHTITDGEGGLRLAEKFIDLERDAVDPDPLPVAEPEELIAGMVRSLGEVSGHNLRRMSGIGRRLVVDTMSDPATAMRSTGALVGEISKVVRSGSDGSIVGSPIWQPRTLQRWFGMLSYPLEDVKLAAKKRGGSINDFFVTGALAGASVYHADRDAAPDRFRVAMPISTRAAGTAGGNAFAVSTNEIAVSVDPELAFVAVKDGLAGAKSGDSVDLMGSLSMVANLLPTSLLTTVARDSAAKVDFTVSNVRGAPFATYIAGARCEAMFPMGPIAGTGFNLTTMSYDGTLDMGLVVDSGAISEPGALRLAIDDAYRALLD